MGYEATCTLKYGGKSARGQAHLEQKDLVFRGAIRLSIPFAAITSARAEGDKLHVIFDGKPAEFAIGAAPAEKWARRILNPPSRLDKLGVLVGKFLNIVLAPVRVVLRNQAFFLEFSHVVYRAPTDIAERDFGFFDTVMHDLNQFFAALLGQRWQGQPD